LTVKRPAPFTSLPFPSFLEVLLEGHKEAEDRILDRFEYGGRNFRHSEIANKQGHDATARMRMRRRRRGRSRKSRIPGE
jgi:hypothetical protein